MDELSTEKYTFQEEQVISKIKEILDEKLKDKEYDELLVPQWINDICEACMEELFNSRKPFKYAVTCAIVQRTGSAVQSSTSCYWDASSDNAIYVVWPKKALVNKSSFVCIVTVFAASFVVGL